MILAELSAFLENLAPLTYQEPYDNAGLLVGRTNQEIKSGLIALDCTEEVINEAIRLECDFVISHHPIVFKGLKKLNGQSYVERVIMKAIKHDIAIYAIHTNLDNVDKGVNKKIAEKLNLVNPVILLPKQGLLKKLAVFVPTSHLREVQQALFDAGAGHIGHYSECSFEVEGRGSFKGDETTNPFVGRKGERHYQAECRLEVVYPDYQERNILVALYEKHPYEEVAYDIYPIANAYPSVGSGMIGSLPVPMDELDFFAYLKTKLNLQVIRHTKLLGKKVQRVALCGGAGGFLLSNAIKSGADVFVTADYKYHEFFDADGKIVIADVGHFESEQFTQELLLEIIQKKFPNFAIRLTGINTNPINYYI